MANFADKQTDKMLDGLEADIKDLYRDAYAEMKVKADEYFEQFEERYEKEYNAWKAGKYTDEQFRNWYQAQIGRGERWEKIRDDLAQRATNANQIASAYINDTTPSVYSLNYNYSAYQIHNVHNVDFTLYDEQTVRELMLGENRVEFRTVRVNPVRDYEWNKELITKSLASGIVQGKSINEIANSFLGVMKRNQSSAIRNARTAVTSAQNGGRIESYKRASEMGINVKKKWLSAQDGRVRDTHAHLNGQIKPYDKKFDNGLMFPADPSGRPEEVYNCRCTLVPNLPDYVDDTSTDDYQKWLTSMGAPYGIKDILSPYEISKQRRNARRINNDLDKVMPKESKWNGTVKRKSVSIAGYDGVLYLDSDAGYKTIVHELTHFRSALIYGKQGYMDNYKIEEATVDFFAREYTKAKKKKVANPRADVQVLMDINKECNLYESDYEFAVEMINVDVYDRYRWITEKIASHKISNELRERIYRELI